MGAENHRTASARSRALRVGESRRTNYLEEPPDRAIVVRDDGSPALDLGLEGAPGDGWGPKLYVEDFERVHLLCDFTFGDAGNDISTLFIGIQASPTGGDALSEWYDVYADEMSDGVLIRKVYELPGDANFKITWPDTRRVDRFMRFKVWVNGATFTDSRATLRARRVMDAM